MQRLLFLFILSLSFMPSSLAASFNCNKAKSEQDKLICATPALSAADSRLATVYINALNVVNDPITLRKAQQDWLTARANCHDTNCLLEVYQMRIAELQRHIANSPIITPRNVDGTYPVWVSPDLGLRNVSAQDIQAALDRKFWDVPAYQRDFKKEVIYLNKHEYDKYDKNILYRLQMKNYEIPDKQYAKEEYGQAPSKENVLPVTCNQLFQRMQEKNTGIFYDALTEASHLDYTMFGMRLESDCRALQLLQYAKPATKSFVHGFIFTKHLADFMPALMVPNGISCSPTGKSEFSRFEFPQGLPENRQKSWREIYGFDNSIKNNFNLDIKKMTPINVKIHSPYMGPSGTEMRILAKGDFNNSQTEQILISMTVPLANNVEETRYQGNALFLLSRSAPDTVLIVNYPEDYLEGSCDGKLNTLLNSLTGTSN